MLRSILGKAMWVGRTVSAVMGLLLVLALLVMIVDSTASAANGKPFLLGKKNVATAVSKLVGKVAGPSLLINNASANSKATALQLNVKPGKPPMKVNSDRKVPKLNADKLDNLDQSAFQRANAAAGGDLTGNYPNPQTAAGAVGATELATLPAVHAHGPSQQTPHNAITVHQFPGEHFDQVGAGQSGEMHSTTTNNSRLIAPRDGIYQVDAQVSWNPNTTGVRVALFSKNGNGSCSVPWVALDRVNATSEGNAYNHLGTLVALNQGDYVEVCVRQTSGGNLYTAGGGFTFATMHYVSPKP